MVRFSISVAIGFAGVWAHVALINLGGEYAWREYLAEWEGRGEELDVENFVPKELDPTSNFFNVPSIAMSIRMRDSGSSELTPLDRLDLREIGRMRDRKTPPNRRYDWRASQPIQLVDYLKEETEMSNAEAAGIILQDMELVRPILDEIADSARTCKYARTDLEALKKPIVYFEERRKPHHRVTRRIPFIIIAYAYQARAFAYLESTQYQPALDDIVTCLHLSRLAADMPGIADAGIAHVCGLLSAQPIWQGLRAQVWNSDQLSILDSELARCAFGNVVMRALKFELACEVSYLDRVLDEGRHEAFAERFADHVSPEVSEKNRWKWVGKLAPRGVFYHNMTGFGRAVELLMGPDGISAEQARRFDAFAGAPIVGFDYKTFMVQSHPTVAALEGLIPVKNLVAMRQYLHLAQIAIGLEKFNIYMNRYPEELDELVPDYLDELPPDLSGPGHSFRYLLRADGRPSVYCVGFDEIDDGGMPSKNSRYGDVVWQYSPPPDFDLEAYALSSAIDE
ncbi:MAG: hypothetical protein R3F19_32090 [Verrucomicrobiales bacterium]